MRSAFISGTAVRTTLLAVAAASVLSLADGRASGATTFNSATDSRVPIAVRATGGTESSGSRTAATGIGAKIQPTQLTVGMDPVSITVRFLGPGARTTRRVEWTIPAGWTPPQLVYGYPGFLQVSSGSCRARPRTGVVPSLNRLASGATRVTARIRCTNHQKAFLYYRPGPAPTRPGTNAFPVRYWLVNSTRARQVRDQPTLTLMHDEARYLAIIEQPTDSTAGAPIVPAPAVEVVDQYGNRIPISVPVTVRVVAPLSSVTGTTVITTNGVARYPSLAPVFAAPVNTLEFTGLAPDGSGLYGATSIPFSVTPASPSKLVFTTPALTTVANQNMVPSPTVRLRDTYGNLVSLSGVSVTMSLQGAPAGVSIAGTATATTDTDGAAIFTDLRITGPATGIRLIATASGMSDAIGNAFNVTN